MVDFNKKQYEGHGKEFFKAMEQLKDKGPVLNAWNVFAPEVDVDRLECLNQRTPTIEDE